MQSNLSGKQGNKDHLFILSGLATAPQFMERFRISLHDRLEQSGQILRSELLFPYGDWKRKVFPQLWEIRHDMRLGLRRWIDSIGGNRTLASIESQQLDPADRGQIIWIGHSGGGVAALHAAKLYAEKYNDSQIGPVVMIGSPRCRIPSEMRHSVFSLQAASDRIARLGTFGGWSAELRRIPVWQGKKYAPADICSLPIIGGHADYFRESVPYVNERGVSNLQITLDTIASWLIGVK